MKATPAAIFILASAALLVSCSHDSSPAQAHDAEGHAAHTENTAAEEGLTGIALNNGQKWQMDDHTRSSFAKMAESFLNIDHMALQGEGLKKAGADLQVDLNALIQGCTMTGAAHDQLHVFLTGYIPAVADLSESGRSADAESVKHYLERYGDYFE